MLLTARDENGWRVPQEGTLSRRIYELAREGKKPRQIAPLVDSSAGNVAVLLHRMKHPEQMNARYLIDYHIAKGNPVIDYRERRK